MGMAEVLDGRQKWTIEQGHVLDVLRSMPDGCCQTVVTSPPYWSLRDYSLPPIVWGGDKDCPHEWGKPGIVSDQHYDKGTSTLSGSNKDQMAQNTFRSEYAFCQKCDAWRGSLGLEPDIDMYISHLIEVFREVRRVMRDDATLWCNIGDSYYGGKPHKAGETNPGKEYYTKDVGAFGTTDKSAKHETLKPKDQCLIPFRFALAMQADGWWVRSTIIWAKGLSFCDTYSGSVMPESVRDRCTTSHEYIFMFTKSKTYYYDQDAVREKQVRDWSQEAWAQRKRYGAKESSLGRRHGGDKTIAETYNPTGRNLRSVWTLPTRGYPGAHFATFCPKLPEVCIKLGTSERGCCPECGAPHQRVVEKKGSTYHQRKVDDIEVDWHPGTNSRKGRCGEIASATIGWEPGCSCDAGEPIPCLCLDPFSGAGTTVMVALRLGRSAVGIELNEEYCEMSRRRIIDDAPLWNRRMT